MASGFDIVIVGAGIVGAACAAELAREGMRVAVVDRDIIGGGATAAGMGHIVVMDDSEAQFALTRYSRRLWRDLHSGLPPQAEYETPGTIWVAADESEMQEVRRKHEYYASRGVAAEILDSKMLAEAEPNLRPGLAGGLLVPDDAVVYPPVVARFLLERERGVSVIAGSAVRAITNDGVALEDGTRISAAKIVNAAGDASPNLTAGVRVAPRKGHLVITDRYPGFVRHQLVELGYLKSAHTHSAESVAFNVQPRRTGQILIGSSRQYGVTNADVDPAIVSAMLSRALQYMPGIGTLSAIRCWTGFRASTPDKLPLIGPAPGTDHVYLATGHEGLGITTSLATAKLLASQITGREPEIAVTPYLPARVMDGEKHA
ncbi:MAG TPA: FAD-dependent oxidoreductase [Terriglobales bacterium]|nr:FAD-dependent oxidoreductase [Terriglobales bacterium]